MRAYGIDSFDPPCDVDCCDLEPLAHVEVSWSPIDCVVLITLTGVTDSMLAEKPELGRICPLSTD